MKVGELIKELSEYPLDMYVIVSEDEEGNHYSRTVAIGTAYTEDLDSWDIEIADEDDIFNGEYGDKTIADYTEVLVIY